MTFRGLHEHSLDSKDRITVPSQYRGALSDGLVLMQGIEKCVEVWPAVEAEAMESATLAGLNPLSREARRIKRSFFAHSASAELDSAGRIKLPSSHIEHAGLSGRCVITGMGPNLEIWNPETWAAEDEENAEQIPALTESLAERQMAQQPPVRGTPS